MKTSDGLRGLVSLTIRELLRLLLNVRRIKLPKSEKSLCFPIERSYISVQTETGLAGLIVIRSGDLESTAHGFRHR